MSKETYINTFQTIDLNRQGIAGVIEALILSSSIMIRYLYGHYFIRKEEEQALNCVKVRHHVLLTLCGLQQK
jgi:hypothetical protein